VPYYSLYDGKVIITGSPSLILREMIKTIKKTNI